MKLLTLAALGLGILSASVYADDKQSTTSTTTTTTQVVTQTTTIDDEAKKNKEAGEAFLAKNKKNKGVITLPSGLQYKIIKQGKGPLPSATDEVTVNYEGKLIDGRVFDSSYKTHQPVSFAVGQVIPGWTEALKLMPVGSTWMLYIPSDLAYGEQGAGGSIGPNSVLIFKVELLGIKS